MTHLEPLLINGARHVMLSYAVIRKRGELDALLTLLRQHPRVGVFIDSGALHFKPTHTLTHEKYFEGYVSFLREHGRLFQYAAEFDADDHFSQEQLDDARQRLRDLGTVPIVPVWKESRSLLAWDRYCDGQDRHLSLSASVSSELRTRLIHTAHKYGKTVHGYAETKVLTTLQTTPFDTVASTTWKSGERFGVTYIFQHNDFQALTAAQGGKDARKKYKKYYESIGCNFSKILKDDTAEVRKANIIAWVRLADRLATIDRFRKKFGDRDGSVQPATVHRHSARTAGVIAHHLRGAQPQEGALLQAGETERTAGPLPHGAIARTKRRAPIGTPSQATVSFTADTDSLSQDTARSETTRTETSATTTGGVTTRDTSESRRALSDSSCAAIIMHTMSELDRDVEPDPPTVLVGRRSTLHGTGPSDGDSVSRNEPDKLTHEQAVIEPATLAPVPTSLVRVKPRRKRPEQAAIVTTEPAPMTTVSMDVQEGILPTNTGQWGLLPGVMEHCNNCFMSQDCPKYQENATCSYAPLLMRSARRPEQVMDTMASLFEDTVNRYQRRRLAEITVYQGHTDKETTKLAQIAMDQGVQLMNLMKTIKSTRVQSNEPGVLARLFGKKPVQQQPVTIAVAPHEDAHGEGK